MDLEKYINRSKSNDKEIWLHNLPNDETLFDVIDNLRKQYNNLRYTFVINQEIRIMGITIDRGIDFSNCIFQEDVDFSGCTFNKKISFSYIKNNQGQIIANASIFEKRVNFSKVIFKESVNFSGTKFSTKIEIDDNSKIIVNFGGVKFEENTRFHYCEFCNNVTFKNTTFNKLVDFYYAKFFKPQQFHLTDFFDRAIFSNTIFYQETQFIYCRTKSDSYIGFESAEFKRGLDISRSNFGNNINFWNITIEKEGEEYIFKNIDDIRYKNDFEAHNEAHSVYKQLRETYRIIKDNLYKQNNKIEGGNFYKKEMNIYLKELNNIIKDKKRKEKSDSTKKKVGSNPFIVLGFYLSGIFTSLYLFLYSINFNDKYCYASFVCFFVFFIVFAYNKWNTKVPINKLHKVRKFWYCFFLSLYIGIYLLTLYYFPMYFSTIFIFEYSFLFIIVLLSYLFLDNDRILLYFNKYSNNFGTNWALGVIFTIVSSLVTYILILQQIFNELEFQLNLVGIGNFLRGLVNVLNVTEWRTVQFFEETPTNWQYIILFIGRILVAYGIYQTIQAFRKFGKS